MSWKKMVYKRGEAKFTKIKGTNYYYIKNKLGVYKKAPNGEYIRITK